MGFVPRLVDQLSTVKESLAFHMVGNAVPVETLGAIIGAMVKMWLRGRVGTSESSGAEVVAAEVESFRVDWHGAKDERVWYLGSALESSASQKGKKKLGKKVVEPKPWYPTVASMVETQRRDPECVALMQQLETRRKGGVPALKLVGVSDERLRYLSLHIGALVGGAANGTQPPTARQGTAQRRESTSKILGSQIQFSARQLHN
jgi:hypothetical protein